MSDDFSRDLSEVIGGHDRMLNNLQMFTQQRMAPAQPYAGPPPVQYISPVVAPPMPPPPPPLPPTVQPPQTYNQLPNAFAQGQAAMTANYIDPAFASRMGGMGGMGMGGMGMGGMGYAAPMHYAPPQMMTPHQYGVFRQEPVYDPRVGAALTQIGGPRSAPAPLLPLPLSYGATSALGFDSFERMRGDLQFRRGFDGQLDLGSEYSRAITGRYDDYARSAGKLLAAGAGSTIGTLAGTAIGAGLGGMYGGGAGALKGATWGGNIGMGLGLFAASIPGVADATAAFARPAIERRMDAIQTQFGSRGYLVGGRDLDMSGSGLSTEAAQRMTYDFDSIARKNGMTRQDITQLAQVSGEQGLLDFAQNGQQIAQTVKGLVGMLATMGEITGDPNFKNNLKKMGQLQRYGFGVGEMGTAMRNMDSFSRMAGLDIDQAMSRGGSQGSSTFQGAGLDAGSGMLTGMYTQGIANLAVQSGAFDERTLALYGGKSGVGQLMTEAQGAFGAGALQQALLPYLMRKGSDGKLTLDKDALARLQSGETSYQDAVRQGGSKFRGDREGMLQLTNNSRELSSLVMRSAGPEAIQQMLMTQGASLADQLGVDLTSGYKAMGLTGDQARVLAQIGETPEFFNKLRQQQQAERQRLGHDAERARVGRSDLTNTAWDRFGDAFGASPWDRMQKGMSNYTARTEEDNRLAAVGAIKLRTQNPLYDSTYKYAGAVQAGRRRYSLGDLGDGTATTGEYLGGKARELSNFYTDEFRERGSGAGGDLVDTAFDDAGIAREAVLDIGTLIQEARGKESYVWMNASRRDRRLSAARDAAGMYVGARQLSDANPAAARSDLINAAQLGGVRGGVPGAHRFLSKAAVLLAQKARKLEDDRSLRQSDMLEALQSAGLSAKDANAVLASPDGAAKLLNLARGVMDSKTRKQMDEHTAKYTAGLSGLAKEGYERRMGASDETSLMKRLTGLGFEADEFSDLSDDQRATLKEFSDMSEDEIAGVFLAAMLNKEDVVGRSEAQDAAEHIMALNPEIADKVAAGMRKLEANPEMRKVIQKDLKKIAKSEDSEYSSVGLETLRSRGQAMKDTQSQLGIASLLKGYRAKATSANVDLADTTSPEEAMSNIAALSSAKKARLDPAVVSAASSGNREAFLRAISSSAGMTSDGVVIGSDGSADEAVEAQDKKISDTAVMAKRFAQYANANAKALEANTRELKRFNDKRDGVAVPVEGPNY